MRNTQYKGIPNSLQEYRKRLGLSQREVAEKLGFRSVTLISRWEDADVLPSLRSALKLARLYNTSIEALYNNLAHVLEEQSETVTSKLQM